MREGTSEYAAAIYKRVPGIEDTAPDARAATGMLHILIQCGDKTT
jgi:hypothetical protein